MRIARSFFSSRPVSGFFHTPPDPTSWPFAAISMLFAGAKEKREEKRKEKREKEIGLCFYLFIFFLFLKTGSTPYGTTAPAARGRRPRVAVFRDNHL
jgi:hypothetical protein